MSAPLRPSPVLHPSLEGVVRPVARVRLATLALLMALPAAASVAAPPAPAPAAPKQATAPAEPKRNIAGPGDYAIREKLMELFGRDAELGKEPFRLVLVNGGAIFSGEIKNCAARKRALSIAATTRGVVHVTDEMTVRRGDVPDAELAKAVTSILGDSAEGLELKDLDAKVEDGVLTLRGSVKDVFSRMRAEDVAGSVMGITSISNQLAPAGAPEGTDDASLTRAVIAFLSDFHQFAHGGDMTVRASQGVVTLKGRVALYMARQQASVVASLVKGVSRVENLLVVDPSFAGGQAARIQAER
ncbi:MAG TPA: BON domain-containing protein [Candidatus Binatia bacterium]|nr:BON domain-containing protein [Candidatus Binatia bacterium]